MRVEAPVFAYDSNQTKPAIKPEQKGGFSRVLNERVNSAHQDSSTQAGAVDSTAEGDIEEPNQDTEVNESVDEQENQDAQTNTGGDQPSDEQASEAFDLVDELTLESLDGALVEATETERIDEPAISEPIMMETADLEAATDFAAAPVAIPLEALSDEGALKPKDSPLVSGWSQAFDAQPVEQQANTVEFKQADSDDSLVNNNVVKNDLSGGAIKLPEGMTPLRLELAAPLDLTKNQAVERLQNAIEFQIRASKSPTGAKQLSLTLNPEGLGRLRILARSDGDTMRITLKVEQGDAARMIERVIPQLEAQIAASVALPVEFELIRDELMGQDAPENFTDFEDEQSTHDQDEHNEDSDLVEQWTKSLEEPVLDLGQTLHVVA